MEARDFRSIGRAAQEELRRRALFLIERQGLSQGEAAQLVGVHRQTVNSWVKRHHAQGEDGLLDGRRVSPRRGKGILSAEEAGQVRDWIVGQTPDQLGLPCALWTSRAVRELIAQRLAKRLGLTAVQLYLQRSGITPQKPLVRAKERQPATIQVWLAQDYSAIAKRARAAGAVIYWGGQTGLSNPARSGAPTRPRARPRSSSALPSGSRAA
jgi:transposase